MYQDVNSHLKNRSVGRLVGPQVGQELADLMMHSLRIPCLQAAPASLAPQLSQDTDGQQT